MRLKLGVGHPTYPFAPTAKYAEDEALIPRLPLVLSCQPRRQVRRSMKQGDAEDRQRSLIAAMITQQHATATTSKMTLEPTDFCAKGSEVQGLVQMFRQRRGMLAIWSAGAGYGSTF